MSTPLNRVSCYSLEHTKHICIVCDKSTEMPYIQKPTFKDITIHICSLKCFLLYGMATNGTQKKMDDHIIRQANTKIKKEVTFSLVTIIEPKHK